MSWEWLYAELRLKRSVRAEYAVQFMAEFGLDMPVIPWRGRRCQDHHDPARTASLAFTSEDME